jgi:hypothetical protein
MNTTRTQIVIPQQLVAEIDSLVGKRGPSIFLTRAAEKELRRLRQMQPSAVPRGATSRPFGANSSATTPEGALAKSGQLDHCRRGHPL